MKTISGLRVAGVVLAIPFALVGCSPNVSPSSPVATATRAATASPVVAPTPPPTRFATSPIPSLPLASPSLEPISLARLGTPGWILISSDTNEGPLARSAILGNVKHNFGFVFTCVGAGDARVSITATNEKMMENPDETPLPAVNWIGRCPTTANVTDLTGRLDAGGYSLSPGVEVPDGVTYRLLIGTLPN